MVPTVTPATSTPADCNSLLGSGLWDPVARSRRDEARDICKDRVMMWLAWSFVSWSLDCC